MTEQAIALTEFGAAAVVELSAEQVGELLDYSSSAKTRLGLPSAPFELTRAGNRWLLSARHVTGFVRAGDVDIEVRPKFLDPTTFDGAKWKPALINLALLLLNDLPLEGSVSAASTEALSVPDLMAESFIRSVRQGSQRGLPRGYRDVSEVRDVVSGRIDFARVFHLFQSPPSVPIVRDELTQNIPINRLLKWAAGRLARLVINPYRGQILRDLASTFHCDSTPPSLPEARRVSIGPQHKGLNAAIHVALTLLEEASLVHAPQRLEVLGLLWNSAELFERFVFKLVRLAIQSQNLWSVKAAEAFATPETRGPKLRTTPDIQIRRGAKTVTILDAKYKTFERAPLSSDVYQVIAAGKIFECANVALVYPGAAHTHSRWALRGAGFPSSLHVMTLDLSDLTAPQGLKKLRGAIWEFLAPMVQVQPQSLAG